jgi:hypothetical protein
MSNRFLIFFFLSIIAVLIAYFVTPFYYNVPIIITLYLVGEYLNKKLK